MADDNQDNKDNRRQSERRKLSLDDIFGGEEIDWSKLGIAGERRKGPRRGIEARGISEGQDTIKKESGTD